jgi:hypothetical protein
VWHRLFPGFLDAGKSGLTPLCQASLDLMVDRFSPQQMSRRPREALAQWLGRRLCSYAGVVPKTKQTGGPDKEPVVGSVQQRCNKHLKNVVLQAVEKTRQFGPEDLRQAAQNLEVRGAHTEYGLAKRLVRLCKYLATTGTIYRPKALMAADTPKATLAAYDQAAWDKLLLKWKTKADLKDVFAPEHPLGQWRSMAKEFYALELRLPQQRAAAAKAGAMELRDWDRASLVGSF